MAGGGSLIGTIVGGVIGTFFGPYGTLIGASLGGMIGGAIAPPHPHNVTAEGPRLADLKVGNASYGQPITWARGTIRLKSQRISQRDIVEIATSTPAGSAGAKGAPTPTAQTNVTYAYYGYWADAICVGPISGVLQAYANGRLVYDRGAGEWAPYLEFFLGGSDQTPDTVQVADHGAGNVPNYRGLAFVSVRLAPLANVGNTIPMMEYVISSAVSWSEVDKSSGLGLSNNDLTATHAGANLSQQGVRATRGVTSGKWYFENTHEPGGAANTSAIGVADALAALGGDELDWIADAHVAANAPAGTVYIAGTLVGGGGSWSVDGDVASVALDMDNRKIWFRGVIHPGGAASHWNGSLSADPATNVGGYDISALGAELFPVWFGNRPFTDVDFATGTVNFAGSFHYAIPSGFTAYGGSNTVGGAVRELLLEAGLASEDFDVSALDTTDLGGVGIGRESTVAQAIAELQQGYFFDLPEIDGQLVAVKRGGAPVATIDAADLGAMDPGATEPAQLVSERIAQDLELPKQTAVTYQSPALDYQPNTLQGSRIAGAMYSDELASVELPLVMTENEAQRVADTLTFEPWLTRAPVTIALPPRYLALDPGDVVLLPVGSSLRPMRLTQKDLGAQGLIQFQAVPSDQLVYGVAPSGAAPDFTGQVTSEIEVATLVLLDIPSLRDADDSLGPYYAVAGQTSAFRGCTIYRSLPDDLETWEVVGNPGVPCPMGLATTVLASGSTTVHDDTSTVTVAMDYGTLESVTRAQGLMYRNAFALGAPGRWEIGIFETATLVGPGTYTLSGLLRGRKGTEAYVGTHEIGDRFVLLTPTAIGRIHDRAIDLNLEYEYRAVSFGLVLADTTGQNFTDTGVILKPYSPVHLTGSRDGSNNLTASWIRRARINAEWQPNVDVPLDEPVELYEIDIVVSSVVVRTITETASGGGSVVTSTTQSALYTAADQTTDGTTPGDPVTFRAYQISARIGRGFPGEATV